MPDWPGQLAGQHVDLRLTAPDGYQAQRSYSISSAPGGDAVDITVERVADGEVSPFLLDEARVGDTIELAARSAAISHGNRARRARCS